MGHGSGGNRPRSASAPPGGLADTGSGTGSGTGPGASKLDKLDRADSVQTGGTTGADGVQYCPVPPKRYAHIALRLAPSQYPIFGRDTRFMLPVSNNRSWPRAEGFHAATGSGFEDAQACESPPSPKKLYLTSESPIAFQGDLTTIAPLVMEPRSDVWQSTDGSQPLCNDYLGASVALHGERTKTLRVTDTGWLKCANLVEQSGNVATEKMGFMLYVYVAMKLNGKPGIYPVIRGRIQSQAIDMEEYEKRKRLTADAETDAKWGSMPLIPGVQKFHALIVETAMGFSLQELWCDGDNIFPL